MSPLDAGTVVADVAEPEEAPDADGGAVVGARLACVPAAGPVAAGTAVVSGPGWAAAVVEGAPVGATVVEEAADGTVFEPAELLS